MSFAPILRASGAVEAVAGGYLAPDLERGRIRKPKKAGGPGGRFLQTRRKAILVGATENAESLIAKNARCGQLDILAVFDDRAGGRAPQEVGGVRVIGRVEDLLTWERLSEVDHIVITVPNRATDRIGEMVLRLFGLPNTLSLYRDGALLPPGATEAVMNGGVSLAYFTPPPQNVLRRAFKRAQDLVLGTIGLIAAAPLMLVVAALVRLDSPGPILFRQKRHGLNNRIIEVLKFRTMRRDETGRPTRQVQADDPRVTRLGRFLRKTSLDELPQLFNVLKGEMSLVGPRPHAIDMETAGVESHRLVAEYAHRHRVKPGMTGWAQINGSRGPVHTPELVRQRVAYDLAYIQRQNVWLDLYIMAMTLPCLLGDRRADR